MSRAGIDTTLFETHSVRSASPTQMKQSGMSLTQTLAVGKGPLVADQWHLYQVLRQVMNLSPTINARWHICSGVFEIKIY